MAALNINLNAEWHKFGSSSVRGYAYNGDQLLCGTAFGSYLENISMADIQATLLQINGFFAFIKRNNNNLIAATDRLRTIPLYYSLVRNNFYISDDAYWISEKVKDKNYDSLAATEFMLTGYVTGANTLYRNVKQLQAGEMLYLKPKGQQSGITANRYFQYVHQKYNDLAEAEFTDRFEQILHNVFSRLLNWAKGRTIVVPLSSGYDSRLILMMLKQFGYENVIAFSYGRPGNQESKISKAVAQALGIRWLFVPYSNEAWYQWFHSEEMKAYYRMADGLCSLPHIQDWPAVRELKLSKSIPDDSIFVPGHSADLLAGSRSKKYPSIYNMTDIQVNSLVQEILNSHYSLWDWSKQRQQLYHILRKRILQSLGDIQMFPDAASAFEAWDVQERQAKFIVNSVRVYEFWGYEWSLPFWDAEFMDFWRGVPIRMRIGQKRYNLYVESLYRKLTGNDNIENGSTRTAMLNIKLKNFSRKTPLYKLLSKVVLYLRTYELYDKYPLCWYGIMSKKQFKKIYTMSESINSGLNAFLVLERLGKLRL